VLQQRVAGCRHDAQLVVEGDDGGIGMERQGVPDECLHVEGDP
jgi:hypothetical protein